MRRIMAAVPRLTSIEKASAKTIWQQLGRAKLMVDYAWDRDQKHPTEQRVFQTDGLPDWMSSKLKNDLIIHFAATFWSEQKHLQIVKTVIKELQNQSESTFKAAKKWVQNVISFILLRDHFPLLIEGKGGVLQPEDKKAIVKEVLDHLMKTQEQRKQVRPKIPTNVGLVEEENREYFEKAIQKEIKGSRGEIVGYVRRGLRSHYSNCVKERLEHASCDILRDPHRDPSDDHFITFKRALFAMLRQKTAYLYSRKFGISHFVSDLDQEAFLEMNIAAISSPDLKAKEWQSCKGEMFTDLKAFYFSKNIKV